MTARCHNDSCSVNWSEVNTASGPAYQADVNLDSSAPGVDATPTIRCGDNGLEVILSAAAGNALSSQADGLAVLLPAAVVTTLSGSPDNNGVGPAATDGSPQDSSTYNWTNTIGRDALVLVSGEFNLDYGILGPEHAYSYAAGNGQKAGRYADAAFDGLGVGAPTNKISPYNAQAAMRLLADVDAPPTTSRKATRVDIGGVIHVSDSDGAERKVSRVPFFWMVRVAAGSTLNMKSQAFWQGPSQTVNVVAANLGTGLAGTGHELWNLQVAAVPT